MVFTQLFDNPVMFDMVRHTLIGGTSNFNRELYDAVKPNKNDFILEIGCGTGSLSHSIIENSHYVGMDISNRFLEKASRKYPDKKWVCGDVKKDIKSMGKFDKVLMVNFLHHFDDGECFKILLDVASIADKVIIVDAIRPISKIGTFLVSMDRGAHIRSACDSIEMTKMIFDIEHTKLFKCGFYTFIVLVCTKR